MKASDTYGQFTKVTLDLNNVTIERLIDEVESKTDFEFVYKIKDVDLERKVSINTKEELITTILKQIFQNTETTYNLNGQRIYLIKRISQSVKSSALNSANVPILQSTITGTIMDSGGQALPGASIVEKGTTNGVTSDFDGNFLIVATSDNPILVISYIGFSSKEIKVDGETEIIIQLQESTAGLDEVIVVGYGSVKKNNLTYSVAKIEGDELSNRPISRLDGALQGQLAGVTVRQSNGTPGEAPSITIRGASSINAGSGPLYVIDGLPVSDSDIIGNLNTSAVESIEVLKDAAAAAIYGSRGAGGVVIVTTKKGVKGRTNISYSSYMGIQNTERTVEMLSGPEQRAAIKEAYEDVNGSGSFIDWDLPADENYNHLKDFFRTGQVQAHQISMSGGSDISTYFGGIDYFNQEGIVEGTGFERISSRFNSTFKLHEVLEIGASLEFGYSDKQETQSHGKGNALNHVLVHPAFLPLDLYRVNTFNPQRAAPYENPQYGLAVEGSRSLDRAEFIDDHDKRGQVLSNTYVKLNLANNLSLKSSFGIIYIASDRRKFNPGNRWDATQADRWTSTSFNWLSETILDYNKTLDKHNISMLVGYTSQKESRENSFIQGIGFPNGSIPTLNAAADYSAVDNYINEWGLVSYLARAIYSYDDRYLLTGSSRRDGSSRFGANSKWGTFSAFSLGWNLHNEKFFNVDAINKFKLRSSWGQTGNDQIGNYDQFGLLYSTTAVIDGESRGGFTIVSGQVENPNLKWEKNNSLDFGIDLGLFKNRIQFTVDYYKNITSDLLLNVPLPTISGFTQGRQNIGEVVNKGFDFELMTRNIQNNNFTWNTSFVININDNEVTKLNSPGAQILSGPWYATNNITRVGDAIGSLYLWEADGVYNDQAELDAHNVVYDSGTPRVGEIKIVDKNGDGRIDSDDRKVVGQPMAKYNFGLTNSFNYKNLDLRILVAGAGGNVIYNAAGREPGNFSFGRPQNKYKYFVDRWSPTNTDGKYPRVSYGGFPYSDGDAKETTLDLFDGDYWRIKNVTLGYTLNSELFKDFVKSVRIYASGENLFLKTKYKLGFNPEANGPEIGAASLINGAGMDYTSFPNARTFSLGINVNF
ncbi:MAG TPA: SusC/RagA family TonB-linked outer membrane protein [Pricia sp.]|nr:SusC/RagA family TonB-linked outer membrane protein [Pricia sp.]